MKSRLLLMFSILLVSTVIPAYGFNTRIISIIPTAGNSISKKIWFQYQSNSPLKPVADCYIDGVKKGQIQNDTVLKVVVPVGDHKVQLHTTADNTTFPIPPKVVTVSVSDDHVTVWLRSTK